EFDHCTINDVATKEFINIQTNTFIIHMNNSILTNKKTDDSQNQFGVNVFGYADNDNTYGQYSNEYIQFWDYWTHDETITNIIHKNPQYADANNGDFTIGNNDLKNLGIGDPRWIQ